MDAIAKSHCNMDHSDSHNKVFRTDLQYKMQLTVQVQMHQYSLFGDEMYSKCVVTNVNIERVLCVGVWDNGHRVIPVSV
jgi:hypothetical protein